MSAAAGLGRTSCPGGVWLELPAREAPRAYAWAMLVFGAVVTGFMLFWMHGASGGWRYRSPGDLIPIAFGLLGLPGLAFGLGMMGLAAALLAGRSRCRIAVLADRVLVREVVGPLQWTRPARRDHLTGVLVREDPAPLRSAILLRRRGAADLRCALGYPVPVLQAVAAELGGLLGSDAPVVAPDDAPPPGNLEVEESGGRLAIRMTGRRGGLVPLAVFLVVWLGVVGAFTCAALGLVGGKPASWGTAAITLPFWAAGLGLACVWIHVATHRVNLLWDGSRLTQIDRSAWRSRIRSWTPSEMSAVLVSQRGSGSGRYSVVTLRPRAGPELDLGANLDGESQAWIAARLRRVLGLPGDAA